jgi:hypothetical protein
MPSTYASACKLRTVLQTQKEAVSRFVHHGRGPDMALRTVQTATAWPVTVFADLLARAERLRLDISSKLTQETHAA